ncbi:MAG: substrate-binding domain-containing protein [Thermonemataceae bacterium]
MKAVSLKIGGVPEHFNLPWRLAIEQGLFASQEIALTWQDFPGGTGAMTKALRAQEIDLAVVLTEGIVADIIRGNAAKILKVYVKSPLTWGIYAHHTSSIQQLSQISHSRYAISRFGSGSHLMAYVHALQQGWPPEQLTFVPLKDLQQMREGLAAGEADVFLWEKVTTQPYVANGELRLIGECITPWPCFLLVVRTEVWEQYPATIQQIATLINHFCQNFQQQPSISHRIAERYKLDIEEVNPWLQQTVWATDNQLSISMLENVVSTLASLQIVQAPVDIQDLIVHFPENNLIFEA